MLLFDSWIFQKLNSTEQFTQQPGMLYYYFSTIADVSANENFINGSGIMFDNNASFATWYKTLPFNQTLALFGPRAYRYDDYNEPVSDLYVILNLYTFPILGPCMIIAMSSKARWSSVTVGITFSLSCVKNCRETS